MCQSHRFVVIKIGFSLNLLFLLFLKKYAGKFLLSCLPTRRSKHEYITVTPEGYRFRSQNFDSIGSLFRWYKEHFRDATPHVTPVASRSAGQSYGPSPHLGKCLIISIKFVNLFYFNLYILEPSPMNRSHTSHSNSTPQYSQSPLAAYNNMQPSAYNTVNYFIKYDSIRFILIHFNFSHIRHRDRLHSLAIILLLVMVLLQHLFMMVYFFILALLHQLFKAVPGHLPLNHQYQQIQMIGDEWLKNGLKLNNVVMEDTLLLCLMVDDTLLATGKVIV